MGYVPFASEEYLRSLLPGWMKRRGREHWMALGRTIAKVVDATADRSFRARAASMPGQVTAADYATGGPWPNIDALPVIGRDRGILAGKHETPAQHARRLRLWHEAKRTAGTYGGLLAALRAVLAPTPPMVRLWRGGVPDDPGVAEHGYCWTLDDTGLRYETWEGEGVFWPADGGPAELVADQCHFWDWDSKYWDGDEETVPDPSRLWAVIYAPVDPEPSALEGEFGDGLSVYGETAADGDKLTTGTDATSQYVTIARAVLEDFKPAGVCVSHIIVTFDETLFDPADIYNDNWPDGLWRHHGKIVEDGGVYSRVRARSPLARYWIGTATRWAQYSVFDIA